MKNYLISFKKLATSNIFRKSLHFHDFIGKSIHVNEWQKTDDKYSSIVNNGENMVQLRLTSLG